MLDSSSKVEGGFFEERWLWSPGFEDECLQINQMKTSFSLLRIDLPENPDDGENYTSLFGYNIAYKLRKTDRTRSFMAFHHGICHPATCSAQDIISLLEVFFNHKVEFSVRNLNRSIKSPQSLKQKIAIAVIVGIIILNVCSAVKYNIPGKIPIGHKSFDMISNFKSALRPFYSEATKDENGTRFLNGMKALYLVISICIHCPLTIVGDIGPMYNPVYGIRKYSPGIYPLIRLVIDGIAFNVLITSIVAAISWSAFLDTANGKLKFKIFLLVRYLRLLPIVLTFVLITIAAPAVPMSGSGILFGPVVKRMSENCNLNGWREVAMIGNWVHAADICLQVGWFLSSDFQLNIICFPLLLTLYRDLRKGIKLAIGYIVVGILLEIGVQYATYDGYVFPSFENLDSFESVHMRHFWTTNCITSYVIGLVVGTLIYRRVTLLETISLNWRAVLALTCNNCVLLIAYLTSELNYWEFSHSKLLIASIIHTTSAILLSFSLYLLWLATPSNPIQRIFTSPIYDFISIILLPSFLSHVFILVCLTTYSRSGSLEIGPFWTQFIGKTFAVLPLSLICGLILHIMVEIPCIKLLKSLLSGSKK